MLKTPFDWATVQMPLNILDAHYHSFQKAVLPECTKRKIGAIGMKALASQNGRIPRDLGLTADLCRRYTLSLPISVLVCGIDSRKDLRQDLAIARGFKPLTPSEVTELLDKSQGKAADGQIEQYKVGNYGCDWFHNQAKATKS
jgi:predicted aldo/keto reductase-like oxidoreductase